MLLIPSFLSAIPTRIDIQYPSRLQKKCVEHYDEKLRKANKCNFILWPWQMLEMLETPIPLADYSE